MTPWLQTYTGKRFALPPTSDMISVRDIAHALSMQCRYAGHCSRFYSVAEHSVLIHDHLRDQDAGRDELLRALFHDGAEAYVTDIPKPLKDLLPAFCALEHQVEATIAEHLGLDTLRSEAVKALDWRILADEAGQLLGPPPDVWGHHPDGPLGIVMECWAPHKARHQFLERAHELGVAPE